MSIVIEGSRRQVFPVEIAAREFVRAFTPENLASLSDDELGQIALAIKEELTTREEKDD